MRLYASSLDCFLQKTSQNTEGGAKFLNFKIVVMKNVEPQFENWTEAQVKRRTFISFGVFTAASVTGIVAWRYFKGLPDTDNGLSSTARSVLNVNEKVNNSIFSNQHIAPTYSKSAAAKSPRVNGHIGIDDDIDLAEWELEIINPATNEPTYLGMEAFKDLPKEDIVFEFKCIEGWNEIVHYGGIKLSDFLKKYNLGKKNGTNNWFEYLGLETPDGEYYVGLDIKSALHPQTLLCFEMNGEALSVAHGAPLRLIIPVKYGVKNLKCIGKMFFSDTPPRDYWHENGYVYDAAL
jgi:DMSO/TMAO reductase YedYZ molybdopterin-dependent catalytic subunit